jgi:hypothetical protein
MRLAAVRPPAPTHHTPPIVLGCDETPGLESADVSLKQAQVNIRLNADSALMISLRRQPAHEDALVQYIQQRIETLATVCRVRLSCEMRIGGLSGTISATVDPYGVDESSVKELLLALGPLVAFVPAPFSTHAAVRFREA